MTSRFFNVGPGDIFEDIRKPWGTARKLCRVLGFCKPDADIKNGCSLWVLYQYLKDQDNEYEIETPKAAPLFAWQGASPSSDLIEFRKVTKQELLWSKSEELKKEVEREKLLQQAEELKKKAESL